MKKNTIPAAAIPFEINFSLDTVLDVDELVNSSEDSIFEGIKVEPAKDKHGKVFGTNVSWDPSSDDGIKAEISKSQITIPALKIVDGKINVYSILKRIPLKTQTIGSDGNPLLYALKNEKHYYFKSKDDCLAVKAVVKALIKEFITKYYDEINDKTAVIVLPSSNNLNDAFSQYVVDSAKEMGKDLNPYLKPLIKISTDDFIENCLDDATSEINQWLFSLSEEKAKHYREQLYQWLDDMNKKHNGLFSYHFIENREIRNHISQTMKADDSRYADYCNLINDHHILLLDDTISRGASLNDACQALCDSYSPKSITALTMFSKLEK